MRFASLARFASGTPFRPWMWALGLPLALPLAMPLPARAEPLPALPLNDTGLTQCVVNGVWQTSCKKSGQDAAIGRDTGKTGKNEADGHAGFQFAKVCGNGKNAGKGKCPTDPAPGTGAEQWACTLDKQTGLIWERKTTDGSLRDATALFTRVGDGRASDAATLVKALNDAGVCGGHDWRLPSQAELHSLVNYGQSSPLTKLDPALFGDVQAQSATWTSQDYQTPAPGYGWAVDFRYGSSGTVGETTGLAVRLVRGGKAPASASRYELSGDEILDLDTRLAWQRCALGQVLVQGNCSGAATIVSWADALAQAKSQAESSGLAWRLPNVKELSSLLDLRYSNPAVDPAVLSNPSAVQFWSSTAALGQEGWAWGVNFSYGYVGAYAMSQLEGVRLVRPLP